MTPDPFDRIAVPPLLPLARTPNVAGEVPAPFSPTYAQEGAQGDGSAQGTSVIVQIIASGGTFTEKTGCNSGTPYTYWAPEWTDDPTP